MNDKKRIIFPKLNKSVEIPDGICICDLKGTAEMEKRGTEMLIIPKGCSNEEFIKFRDEISSVGAVINDYTDEELKEAKKQCNGVLYSVLYSTKKETLWEKIKRKLHLSK